MLHRASELLRTFEYGNELSCSVKDGEFLVWLSDYQLLKKDCVPWS
jgi:hypothetical protein